MFAATGSAFGQQVFSEDPSRARPGPGLFCAHKNEITWKNLFVIYKIIWMFPKNRGTPKMNGL